MDLNKKSGRGNSPKRTGKQCLPVLLFSDARMLLLRTIYLFISKFFESIESIQSFSGCGEMLFILYTPSGAAFPRKDSRCRICLLKAFSLFTIWARRCICPVHGGKTTKGWKSLSFPGRLARQLLIYPLNDGEQSLYYRIERSK